STKFTPLLKTITTSQLSNGFLEGGNNRLKMIKRMMYGRARLPLLRAKVLCYF
ncbi:MAG: transposase, partial [Clostridiaceae bacterium]|nr:transposase [Clostridiaceae bacterium]